ncbi:MAG TPA: hypothetical protein DCF91_11945 [Porphyromonadaceae bacterium]|nr:hypothetical protein [Porphyromonadaceae bacterium]
MKLWCDKKETDQLMRLRLFELHENFLAYKVVFFVVSKRKPVDMIRNNLCLLNSSRILSAKTM